MRFPIAAIWVSVAFLLGGCSPRASQERLHSLTDDDCRILAQKVIPLCAATPPPSKDESGTWLRGAEIPSTLSYLKPTRVYLSDSSATIELWRGASGDDTLYVIRDDEGGWQISAHEGDLLKKDRLIWSSRSGK